MVNKNYKMICFSTSLIPSTLRQGLLAWLQLSAKRGLKLCLPKSWGLSELSQGLCSLLGKGSSHSYTIACLLYSLEIESSVRYLALLFWSPGQPSDRGRHEVLTDLKLIMLGNSNSDLGQIVTN